MTTFTRLSAAVLLAASLAAIGSHTAAQTAYTGPVAVVVAIPIPAGLTRSRIEAQFKQVAPQYQAEPQLKQKYFTVNATRAGGIYLFTNRTAVDAYFNDAWRSGVVKTFGSAAEVTIYDAPLIIQGGAGMKDLQP